MLSSAKLLPAQIYRATHDPVEFDKILKAQCSGESSIRWEVGGDNIQEEERETGLFLFVFESNLRYRGSARKSTNGEAKAYLACAAEGPKWPGAAGRYFACLP